MRKTVFTVLAAVLVSGLTGCGHDDPKPALEETVVELEVQGGKRSAGPDAVEVARGVQVVFVVAADAPDELHLHGYDKTAKVEPGKPARLSFTADLPGVWELELHESGALLTTLTVTE